MSENQTREKAIVRQEENNEKKSPEIQVQPVKDSGAVNCIKCHEQLPSMGTENLPLYLAE